MRSFFPQRSQEGFNSEILISTPFGYKKIGNIIKGDSVIDFKGEQKRVIAATAIFVDKYVKLVIDNTYIYTGCEQIYYTHLEGEPILAQNIKVADVLLSSANSPCLVIEAELINQPICLYYLTVEDHVFCIAPKNLCVHNAEVIMNAFASISLGCITVTNPIAATIAATIALSFIVRKSYEAYIQENEKNVLLTDVICAERSYYLQRSAELETLKQELIDIKNALEGIQVLYNDNLMFTYQLFKQVDLQNTHIESKLLKISVENEIYLSDKKKENLRIARESEVEYLEQEIITLQRVLAFHVNALVEGLYFAENEYKEAQKEIIKAAILWNNNRDRINNTIALEVYKAILLDEHLLNNFNQKLNELKIVAQYYAFCNSMCIKQSTNIIDIFEQLKPMIIEYDQWIAIRKVCIDKNILEIEKHFAVCDISITQIKNETKSYLEKGRNVRNAQATVEAKEKLEVFVVAGSPKKNNNNDDNGDIEYPFGKYENAPYHTNFGNFIKSKAPCNGQRALDNSISLGKNTSRRIGISDGEIVILDQTSPGLFHGHVRSWNDLTQIMKNVLTEANLVTSRGKIK